jgi:methyl-accepting chemotaxis protein
LDSDFRVEQKDEIGEIYSSMFTMSDKIKNLVHCISDTSEQAALGNLSARAQCEGLDGEYQVIVKKINEALVSIIDPLFVAAEYVDRISKGEMPEFITADYKGDFAEVKTNLNVCIEAITALIEDANMLSKAAVEGRLDTRADATRHSGDYAKIVKGVNDTLDSVIGPLTVTAEYVDRISKGDMPPMITDNYNGDFNEIKTNLNLCIESIQTMVDDALNLADSIAYGKLRERADEMKHNGEFRRIMDGMNLAFDGIVNMLDNLPAPVMSINKEFDVLFMNKLGAEVNFKQCSQVEGSKCFGHFNTKHCNTENCITGQTMRDGLNKKSNTIATVAAGELEIEYSSVPLKNKSGEVVGAFEIVTDQTEVKKALRKAQKIADYQADETEKIVTGLELLAQGQLNTVLEINEPDADTSDSYETLKKIISAAEVFTGAVVKVREDIVTLAQAAVSGQLDVRVDADAHSGDFVEIVAGLNETLDAVIAPINEAGDVLSEMASGDLTARMLGQYEGELQKLKNDINQLGDSLHDVIGKVTIAANETANGAQTISESSETIATASQEMNSQADDVASAVEEMARTVTENAQSATRTSETARANAEIATSGGKVVQDTVAKMNDIARVVEETAKSIEKLGESSQAIGDIVKVIDDIADQTNLLALNASIEAARAGEQGRGFAVVADEVRKLAEKTVGATKEIAEQITTIQKETADAVVAMNRGTGEVESGISLAAEAGTALENVLASSNDLLQMISDIAAASEEQAATTEEISRNVLGISQATSESTMQIEEVASIAEQLNGMTVELKILMEQFNINSSGHDYNSLESGYAGELEQ